MQQALESQHHQGIYIFFLDVSNRSFSNASFSYSFHLYCFFVLLHVTLLYLVVKFGVILPACELVLYFFFNFLLRLSKTQSWNQHLNNLFQSTTRNITTRIKIYTENMYLFFIYLFYVYRLLKIYNVTIFYCDISCIIIPHIRINTTYSQEHNLVDI